MICWPAIVQSLMAAAIQSTCFKVKRYPFTRMCLGGFGFFWNFIGFGGLVLEET
jgi:hypothetical protein